MDNRRVRRPALRGVPLLALLLMACDAAPTEEERIVLASIDRHGGARFDDSRIRFTFRGTRFDVLMDRGVFRYERSYRDALGRAVVEVMDNTGTRMAVDGEEVVLDAVERERIEVDVNSVVYFGFLPHRLRDSSARLRDLGPDEVEGEPYHRIEVTFEEAGGGADWDARFVHWIHRDRHTLDYFGYRYSRGEGGTRFRRAVQPREIGGLLIQDWENYSAEGDPALEEYPALLEAGALNLLSLVALEDVEVFRAAEGLTQTGAPDAAAPEPAPDDGLEVAVGVDRSTYRPGEEFAVVIRLTNLAPETRTIEFASSQRFDVVLLDEEGSEVASWSQDRSFLQVVGEETLAPGETMDFEADFAAPGTPGSWYLQARIPASGADLRATLPIEVLP